MKVDSLIKKRANLDEQIRQFAKNEKRKARIGALAETAGILNMPDDALLASFKRLAAANKNAAPETGQKAGQTDAGSETGK